MLHKRKRRRIPFRKPELTVRQILAWADEYHNRTGQWPKSSSGRIAGSLGETWKAVDMALVKGLRGLPGGSSLARLLAEHFGVRNPQALPPLTVPQILAWADAHHERTGEWPLRNSGPIAQSPGETWKAVEMALVAGRRGLPGGSSLARLLAARRGVRNRMALPRLNVARILAWADAHRRRTGQWPTEKSGPILDAPGETWLGVDSALGQGGRGLSGGSSLPRLLAAHRGVRNIQALPQLTAAQVLTWADNHFRRTGAWPTARSGAVADAPGEQWFNVNAALIQGHRGFPGDSSLAQLLAENRGVRNKQRLPALTVGRILAWVDTHRRRTGAWPKQYSGPVQDAPGETWLAINSALDKGGRGLPGGSSLARLLHERRGARNQHDLAKLTPARILAWADAYYQRFGRWPTRRSGPIPDSGGETWQGVESALYNGRRGFPGGITLAQFLGRERGVRNRLGPPPLTAAQIRRWARSYYRRTARWPTAESGPVAEAAGETWLAIDKALRQGRRGLPAGSSLAKVLHPLKDGSP